MQLKELVEEPFFIKSLREGYDDNLRAQTSLLFYQLKNIYVFGRGMQETSYAFIERLRTG